MIISNKVCNMKRKQNSSPKIGVVISDMFYREPITIRRFDFSSEE